MTKTRLEAFSDGVIAILITIMVLELKVPHGDDWHALAPMTPVFFSYALSFVFLGIYWNNHHHLLHAAERINGRIMWANLHLLFWLSLTPVGTAWMGEHPRSPLPNAFYGTSLLASAIAYYLLQHEILKLEGSHSRLRTAVGSDFKGKISPLLYLLGIVLAFFNTFLADAIYVTVALMWLVPDRRIERQIDHA